jgi:hypothetical protein
VGEEVMREYLDATQAAKKSRSGKAKSAAAPQLAAV